MQIALAMISYKSVLSNILNGKCSHCCLCLQTLDSPAAAVSLHDEIIFENDLDSLEFSEVLAEILDDNVLHLLHLQNAVCKHCKKSAMDSFLFVKMCKDNYSSLAKIINNIHNSTEDIASNFYNSESAFIVVNSTDFSTETHYEEKRPENKTSDFERYQTLLSDTVENSKTEDTFYNPVEIKYEDFDTCGFAPLDMVKIKKVYTKTDIPTSEMMFENSLKCSKCFRVYATKQHLRQHYIRVHAPKKFPCKECRRSYSTKGLLDQHKFECHTPAICSECGKTYKNRFSLSQHEQGHKTKIICPDCGRAYKHRKTFNKHIELNICQQKERKSNSEGRFICDYCGKKFSHKGTLRVHIKFEHGPGNPHTCSWCSKKFYAESKLKAHIVKHTREKKFICDICGGKYVTKESLLYHTRIHTGERPYSCNVCDQKFLSSSRRAAHIRKHMAASYECEICHSKFKERAWLVKHTKRHLNPNSRLHCTEKPCAPNELYCEPHHSTCDNKDLPT